MPKRFLRDHLEAILIAIAVALVLRLFVVSAYKIPSESMAPNLITGDFIFGFKLPFGMRVPILGTKVGKPSLPSRGDTIIFQIRDENLDSLSYVKRVVALPGDRFEMRAGIIYLNEVALEQKFERKVIVAGKELDAYTENLRGLKFRILMPADRSLLNAGRIVVPPKHIFVLADNRISGDDSRHFGPVALSQVEARVILIWLSLQWYENQFFPGLRWDRLFMRVH